MAVAIGQEAPDFSLFDSDKNNVNLGDFKGKNVLVIFSVGLYGRLHFGFM